jgi:hypothetical protein
MIIREVNEENDIDRNSEPKPDLYRGDDDSFLRSFYSHKEQHMHGEGCNDENGLIVLGRRMSISDAEIITRHEENELNSVID